MDFLIVGLGSMGKRRARLLRGIAPQAGIFGVDAAPARREEAKTLGIPAYESIDAAVADRRFDAALVCTAPLAHAAIIGQLLDAGLSVFTELNLVPDGYRENMQKAQRKGLLLFLSSTMLYRGETQYIARRVKEFDRPVSYLYHIGQYLPDWHPWENYKNFFVGDPRTGGCREIFGIELPWLLDAFGPVKSVFAVADKLSALSWRWTLSAPKRCAVSRSSERGCICFGRGIRKNSTTLTTTAGRNGLSRPTRRWNRTPVTAIISSRTPMLMSWPSSSPACGGRRLPAMALPRIL